jgi:hypothetical protein
VRLLATWASPSYAGHVAVWSTTRILAVTAAVFAAVAVVLLASVWLFNLIPQGADCGSDEGYAAMKAHADANGSLAGFALLFTGLSSVVCLVGAVRGTRYRLLFALGVVPLLVITFVSLAVLIASGLYCQN